MRSPGGGPISSASNKCCESSDFGKQRWLVITPAGFGRAAGPTNGQLFTLDDSPTAHPRRISSYSEKTTLPRGTIPKQTGRDTAALPVKAFQIAADTSGKLSPRRRVG